MESRIDPNTPESLNLGRIDPERVDATTKAEIAWQVAANYAYDMKSTARFVRHIRLRLGLSQAEFAERINVPLEATRNWKQGKRRPTRAAKALLKILDKAPEAALVALH
ncbi:helix-turn-helix domain-containing protein [Tepidiphilus succinatimandens]|uniref:helix-turn-helix domain-containing protein n=1 Tax=Tepidiphilus succinatimandens TaxID=224436 RepID=UPI00197CDD15|nr:helix-turn-helix domain-containing protein [Tepidiphilus succinatimandens]